MILFLGALVAVWLCAAGAPSRAEGFFVGETDVIKGTALTAGAETVMKTPGFWEGIFDAGVPPNVPPTDGWGDFGGGGGMLPLRALGAGALAFGVGTVIGSEICHSILSLEGCWYFGSEGADPAPAETFTFQFFTAQETTPLGNREPGFSFYWSTKSGGSKWPAFYGYSGECGSSFASPAGTDLLIPYDNTTTECTFEAKKHKLTGRTLAVRWGTTNRKIEWHAKDEPGISNSSEADYCAVGAACSTTPPSNWSERATTCLKTPGTCGLSVSQAEKIGQTIASETEQGKKEGIHNPYKTYVEVPNCDGLLYASCATLLEERGLKPSRKDLSWSEVTTSTPNEVQELNPARSTEVEKGLTVTVVSNPSESGMPVVIPDPEPHETYSHYVARLNPALSPTRVIVSDVNEDAGAGPDAVLEVQPQAGTRVNPSVTTPVEVKTNPHDAPAVAGAPGSCNTSIGAIDWSPLNHSVGSKFPFGVFGFFVTWIGEWEAGEGAAPEWDFTIVPSGLFGSKGLTVHVDLGVMAPAVGICRVTFLFASFVGLLWFLGTAAAKLQGDDS